MINIFIIDIKIMLLNISIFLNIFAYKKVHCFIIYKMILYDNILII